MAKNYKLCCLLIDNRRNNAKYNLRFRNDKLLTFYSVIDNKNT